MSDPLTTMLAAQYPPDHWIARIAELERERDAAIKRIAKLEAALAERTKERDAANGEEK